MRERKDKEMESLKREREKGVRDTERYLLLRVKEKGEYCRTQERGVS